MTFSKNHNKSNKEEAFISIMITLLYIWYEGFSTYRRREVPSVSSVREYEKKISSAALHS
jgi:hypothetical protein